MRQQPRKERGELDVGDLLVLGLLSRGQGEECRGRPLLAVCALRRRAALLVEVVAPQLPRAPNRARHPALGPVHPWSALMLVEVSLLVAIVAVALLVAVTALALPVSVALVTMMLL